MTNRVFFLFCVFTTLSASTPLPAANSFVENFDRTTVSSYLAAPGGFLFGDNATPAGTAQNSVQTDSRYYIATVASDFANMDFLFEITVIVRGSAPSEAAFVGFGSAVADPNYFTEPHSSIYFRLFPNAFLEGALGLSVSKDPSSHEEAIVSASPHPGVGIHRVQFRKVGRYLTMSCDANHVGGPFTPDYSVTRRMDTDLAFLNATNSRLFFGVQGTQTTFDDLRVQILQTISIEVSEVSVCWPSVLNAAYQVQYRSEATDSTWLPLGLPVRGNGSNNCVSDGVLGQPRRFYRVLELPGE